MSTNAAKRTGGAARSPARRAAVQRRAAYASLPQVLLGLGVTYAVLTPLPVLRAGLGAGGALAAFTAAMGLAMVALRGAVRRGRLSRRQTHVALGLALASLVARGVIGWAVFGSEQEIGLLGVIVLVIGTLCVSAAWTVALIAALEVGWLAVRWALGLDWPPAYVVLFVTGAAPVAVAIRAARIEAMWRDERRRQHDLRHRARLAAATARAGESERRFRGIFERIHDVYLRASLDGRIEMVSPSVVHLGYQPHELVGRDARTLLAPDDIERCRAELLAGGAITDAEMRWRGRDGVETVVSVSAGVVRDASGAPVAYEGLLRDISERKRAEEERRQQQAELAHVLRLNSMGEMAAEIAHELTQPLAAIVNYAGACARYMRGEPDERAKVLQGLELISAQGLRAGEIVRRIRSYVAKRPPQRELIDVTALARQAARTVAPESRRVGLPIVVHGADGACTASVDAIQIEQVIVNLLLNALEAVPAPAPGDEVSVCIAETAAGEVEVAVSDPGCGLGALAGRIFDPFFSTKMTGLGMGLAISRSIVETHGGRLWATPNAERGTTFHFTLPRRSAAPERDDCDPALTLH
jgi:PAS domain S-box-containing protein